MSNFLLLKLEALMVQEEKNKLEQKVLMDKIELEIETKRRLEMDSTVTKLRTLVDELAKNIEGNIMPNNIQVVHHNIEAIFKREWDSLRNSPDYDEMSAGLREKQADIRKQMKLQNSRETRMRGTTLENFIDNVSKLNEEEKLRCKNHRFQDGSGGAEMVIIGPEIKIYHDIVPIFATVIGILNKQQSEIEELKRTIRHISLENDFNKRTTHN